MVWGRKVAADVRNYRDADNEFIFYSYNAATSAVRRSISAEPPGDFRRRFAGDTDYNIATSPSASSLFQLFERTCGADGYHQYSAIRRIRINIAAETKTSIRHTAERKK